jgi:uncharacterized membrane-anchored protein
MPSVWKFFKSKQLLLAVLLVFVSALFGQDPVGIGGIGWQHGPTEVEIGDQATINLPEGFIFTGMPGTQTFLELTENISSGSELGVLAPEDFSWFALFEFDGIGYVKDDEKDALDADAMLSAMQKGEEEANKIRRERGWGTYTLVGWVVPPHYDSATNNLEWCLKGQDEAGGFGANHNTRYLGRKGVMSVQLVAGVETYETDLRAFRQVLQQFSYVPENNYLAFEKGDKIAEYGLTALVVGGAAAVASKTGLLKSFWKLIVAALLGLGALIKKLLGIRKEEPT